ncbi:MAG: insulinase family protein [Deltaproteobacteria bacterium]|nr:insulinase family protein [Deltaproteobacteria bacterium]
MIGKTTLENGILVITEEIPHVHSISVGIWIKAGSRDERRGENGISHFIEHMLFKGTKRRSAHQIAKEIDAVGGVLNAFTSKEYSSFYAKILAEHLPLALDLLFDLFLNSLFSAEEIEKERQVIVQEINMIEDTPDEYIHDLFSQSFWPRHPLGFPIFGRLETISRMNRTKLMEFFHQHYLDALPIIVAAGNLKHESLLRPVQETLGRIKPRGKKRKTSPPCPHPHILVKNKKLEQVHLLLGTQGPSAIHPQRYAFSLLNTILGGGMSSRLFQEIREKRGLAYSVYSFLSSFMDSGMLGVYVGTGDSTLSRVLQLILREMKKLAGDSLRPKELRAAKEQLKGNLLLSLESVESRMGRLAKNELYFNRFVSTEEIIEGIEKVRAEEICALAHKTFQSDSLSLTVLGHVTEKAIPKGLLAT